MSGFEVLGAISGIITILETASRFSDACRDANGIPSSIRDAHARLPLVIETLKLVEKDVQSNWDPDSYRAMKKALKHVGRKQPRWKGCFPCAC